MIEGCIAINSKHVLLGYCIYVRDGNQIEIQRLMTYTHKNSCIRLLTMVSDYLLNELNPGQTRVVRFVACEDQLPTLQMFRKMDYRATGIRAKHYGDLDGIVMERILEPSAEVVGG